MSKKTEENIKVKALSLEEAHQLLHEMRTRQSDLEVQNQELKRELGGLRAQKLEEAHPEKSRFEARDRRKQVESNMHPDKGLLRCIIDTVGDLIYVKDMDGVYRGCNKASERFVGLKEVEQIGKTDFDFFSQDQAKVIQDTDRLIMTSGHEHCVEEWVPSPDGKKLLLETKKAPFFGPDGKVAGIVGISRDITERKALEENYKRLSWLTSDYVHCCTRTGTAPFRVQWTDGAVNSISGYHIDEVLTFGCFLPLVHPDDRQTVADYLLNLVPGDRKSIEFRILTQQKEIRWVLEKSHCEAGQSEEELVLLGAVTDITERKLAAEALRESEERFRLSIEYAPEAITLYDIDLDCFVDCNVKATELFGCSREEFLAGGAQMFYLSEQPDGLQVAESIANHNRQALAGNVVLFERAIRRANGQIISCEVRLVQLPSKNRKLMRASFSDITERKKAEDVCVQLNEQLDLKNQELRETNEYLTNLINYSNAPIIVWNPNNIITKFNHAFEHLTGHKADEVMGKELEILFPQTSRDNSINAIRRTASGEYWESVEIPILRKDGEMRVALWNSANIHAEDGKTLIATIAQGIDITERKQAEEVLRESDQMKSEFIKTVAHEFRTPLTSIMGFSELLLTHDQLSSEEQRESLNYIHESSMALTNLVADILDIARIDSGAALSLKRSLCSVTEIFRQVQPFLKTQASLHRLEVNLTEETTLVNVDKGKIGQVLENLLSNAVTFSPAGSLVRIKGDLFQGGYRISVADQGDGMTPEQVAKVFDKFYRADTSDTAVEGVGLGMHIVKHIVEGHGGKIWVESELGKGTTVSFTFPLTLRQVEENPNS